jgi:hypothetical protein
MALVGILATQVWHYLFVQNLNHNLVSESGPVCRALGGS